MGETFTIPPVIFEDFVPSVEWCGTFKKAETLLHVPGQNYLGGTYHPDPMEKSRGWLTAIVVFTGELGGDFRVLDARDGSVVHRYHLGSAMSGGIVTYQVAGRQYIAVASGSTTRFWRTPQAAAAVTIFAVPAPGAPRGRLDTFREHRAARRAPVRIPR